MLSNRGIALVTFLWWNHKVEKATWKRKDDVRARCPKLFEDESFLRREECNALKFRALSSHLQNPVAHPKTLIVVHHLRHPHLLLIRKTQLPVAASLSSALRPFTAMFACLFTASFLSRLMQIVGQPLLHFLIVEPSPPSSQAEYLNWSLLRPRVAVFQATSSQRVSLLLKPYKLISSKSSRKWVVLKSFVILEGVGAGVLGLYNKLNWSSILHLLRHGVVQDHHMLYILRDH
ncbi:pol protein [Cucumis melo var. makuwa]|uniref:Pol protein n=1 Tax=Cucumis melo var. makuwa TaxID=1194695 RepID=A0A5A7V2C9_CUCMM|nr:pol protein [Cucumis melo var. makuwa]